MNRKTVPNAELFAEVRRLLGEGCRVTILARGNSMMPFIRDGVDEVELASPESGSSGSGGPVFAPGDILLCELAPGNYVLHRLLKAEEGRLTLMGDGNLRGTESCPASSAVARAVRIVRPDGRRVDCCSRVELRKARIWRRLLPFRRILLALWRRLHLPPL